MTKLEPTPYEDLCKIVTDSFVINQWIPKSPSRLHLRLEKGYAYPISELEDLFAYARIVSEPITMHPEVSAAHIKFQAKKDIMQSIRNGSAKFEIPKPLLFKNSLDPKYYYQFPIISQILLMHKCLLVVPVGLGKTVVALYTLLKIREMLGGQSIIVCESNQIHKPWIDTILKFTDIKDLLIIEGNAEERARKIAYGKANLHKHWLWIASYDTIKIEYKNMPQKWNMMVFDEITKIKNISTDAFKAIATIDAPYKIGLSATPIMTNYLDLYGIMKTINPYTFTSKQNYMDRYLELDYFQNAKGVKKGMEEELKNKVAPWTYHILKSDVMDVKPKSMITIPVPLTPLQQTELNRILGEIANGERTAFESGTILRQICNTLAIASETQPVLDIYGNPVFDSAGKPKLKSVLLYPTIDLDQSTNKILKLKELIHEIVDVQKKKVVVFSFFKTAVMLLQKELGKSYGVKIVTGDSKKGCKHPSVINCSDCMTFRYCKTIKKEIFDFVEGDIQILLGTDSLSRAHNLPTCDTLINFDLPWDSATMEQRIGRIDRSNNLADKLLVYNIVTLGTIEERIIKIIENKEKESDKVFPKYNVSLSRLSKTIKVV